MERLPSLMCCTFKTCHVTQSIGLLLFALQRWFPEVLIYLLSPDEAPKSESFDELMTEHYIRWKPMGSMSRKQETLSSVHHKKKLKKKLLARKCLKQFIHPGISYHILFTPLALPCLHTTQIKNIHLCIFSPTQPEYILKLWEASHLAKCCYYSFSSKIKKNIIIKALKFL